MKRNLEAICTGTARPFNGAELSAFVKRPRTGKVQLLEEGLAPDEQADRNNHGGPDMALHLYPLDHHAYWRSRLGDIEVLDEPGAFGSNLSVKNITEDDVHIGDRFTLGSALIEISQPRQPCWKIEHRFSSVCKQPEDAKGMVMHILETARCGWYFRVLETGEVQAGDCLARVETGEEAWPISRAMRALILGKATPDEFAELAQMDQLSGKLRERAAARLT